MRFKLISADNVHAFELKAGATQVIGRAPTSDVPVFDPTISRRHAELTANDSGVHVRDLGSSNGTFHNGSRVESCTVMVGETITFGKVAFKLQQIGVSPTAAGATTQQDRSVGSATILGRMEVHGNAIAAIASNEVSAAPSDHNVQQKLNTLLQISMELGKARDTNAILEKIVDQTYHLLTVDRVAIQLMDDTGSLVTKIARDKRGAEQQRAVPQSIARAAINDKVAILSDNAGEDQRFGGQSILMQQVRSAICCPLLGNEERVLGVLYVDNVSASHRFSKEDMQYLVAFSGIAAVAIENSQYAERIRREALVRSNFERYFTPQLAERIAASEGETRLGGDKREVTVLFSDIRGFTALSEEMPPSDMATFLTDYFTEMVECVFKNEGTLDKFIGDAVMAQWGAPLGNPDDPDKAMSAAIEMMHELAKLNKAWKAQGRPQLEIGIGLNHGEAFAGNIGSEKRLEYTVIGDTVNTASRLCSAAGPGEILISEEMKRALSKKPKLEEVPPMELKNKTQPVKVYKVVI